MLCTELSPVPPLTLPASLSELRLVSVPPEEGYATGKWEKGERKHLLSEDSPHSFLRVSETSQDLGTG